MLNKGIFLIIFTMLLYGLTPVMVINIYGTGANVMTLIFFRYLITAIILLFMVYPQFKKVKFSKADKISSLIIALLTLCISFFNWQSLSYISPSLAVLIMNTSTLYITIYNVLTKKEILTKKIVISIVIMLFGILLLCKSIFVTSILGVFLSFVAAFSKTAYVILSTKYVKKFDSTFTNMIMSSIISVFVLLIAGPTNMINFHLGKDFWMWIGIYAIIATIGGVSFFKSLALIGSTKTALMSMLEPLFVTLFSVVLLNDNPSGIQIMGGLLIIGGSILVVATKSKEEKDNYSKIEIKKV